MNPYIFLPEAIVLDAGDYPTHQIPKQLLAAADKVVCCDGATLSFIQDGQVPWRIIGDGDSLPTALKEEYAPIFRQIPEQETNDQTKAVRYLHQHQINRIAILGATGKREDHTLGNISLLIEYMKKGLDVRMFTDHGVFIPCQGKNSWEVPVGTQVSIFSFGVKDLKGNGLQYPLSDFTNWWQGTLNQATASSITLEGEGNYLLFFKY